MRDHSDPSRRTPVGRWLWLGALLLAGGASGGCASFSNPTLADSIPVHRLPPEVFGRPREEERTIPLTLLRQKPPERYLLDAGDVLGVYIEGVLGRSDQPVPVYTQQAVAGRNPPPAFGYPIVVQDDGTISLPLIRPINVKGKSQTEAQELIREAYIKGEILKPGAERILVSIIRKRTYHVTVIRQDSGGNVIVSAAGQLTSAKRGTGIALDLDAYENDVLTALAQSGGLPGLDASNTVVIQRGATENVPAGTTVAAAAAGMQQVRIPLRMRPNEPLPFRPEDVVLRSGDIVFIESRETEVYYTGGLLPVAELILPRDYDLDVLEAVTQARGPLLNGGVNFNNFVGNITTQGIGAPSPSLLTVIRKTPDCGQIIIRIDLNRAAQDPRERILVQPGDFLILQESLGESFTRWATQTIRFSFLFRLLNRNDATINAFFDPLGR